MLDFGFSEILLTSAIALVVLGPERLPKVARQVGNWMGRARVMARQLSEQLEREVSAEELLKETMKPKVSAANRLAAPIYDAPQYTAPQVTPQLNAPPVAPPFVLPDPHTPLPQPHAEYEPSSVSVMSHSGASSSGDLDTRAGAAAHGEQTPRIEHATSLAITEHDAGSGHPPPIP